MFDLSEKTGINDFINKHCREMGWHGRRFDFRPSLILPAEWEAEELICSYGLGPCPLVGTRRGEMWSTGRGVASESFSMALCVLPSAGWPVLTRSVGWAVQGWALTLHGQDAAVQAQHAGFALCCWAFQVFPLLNEAVSFPSACTCTFAGVSFSVCAGWQGRAWRCLRHSHGLTQMSPWASHHLPFQRIILNRQVGKRATRITQRQEMTLSISRIK